MTAMGRLTSNSLAPAMFQQTSEWMWPYSSAPDANLNGRSIELVQGRALGGGTAVNGMVYCRGAASVFDEWAHISGNNGLAWDSMLEAFRATSHWTEYPDTNYSVSINESAFGDGPLEVTSPRMLLSIDQPFYDQATSMLNLTPADFVSGQGVGISFGIQTIKSTGRTRQYAPNTFGNMAKDRQNYRVLTNAWVSKIGFTNMRADAVTYLDGMTGDNITIPAKQIIVAAGAINTPQLLKLSGVGPADELNSLGIPVVIDSPQVGQNLVNHHYAVAQYEARPETDSLWQLLQNSSRRATELSRYRETSDGMFGTMYGSTLAEFRLPDSVFEGTGSDYYTSLPQDRPHVALFASSSPFLSGSPNTSLVAGFASVVQPESSGNVTLASSNFQDPPVIYSNYWATPSEVAAVKYAFTKLREVFQSDALKPYCVREQYPGTNTTNDADLWSAIQGSSRDWHHPVGTAALGTVLDANWRVRGVSGLRVVGSAAAPTIPTCPIQAAIYAMAYRSAIDIAETDRLQTGFP